MLFAILESESAAAEEKPLPPPHTEETDGRDYRDIHKSRVEHALTHNTTKEKIQKSMESLVSEHIMCFIISMIYIFVRQRQMIVCCV